MRRRVYLGREKYGDGYRWRVTTREGGQRTARSFADEGEARDYYRTILKLAQSRNAVTVGELIDRWLEDLARRNKDSSVSVCARLVRGLCDVDALVADVDTDTATEWYRAYQAGRSAATHQQALTVTKQCWTWAHADEEMIKSNPFRKVRAEGQKSRRKRQLRVNEARTFISYCLDRGRDPDIALLCCLLLGMRPGEVLAMVARDVDDGARLVWIPDGKTEHAQRVLEVPEVLRPHLSSRAVQLDAEDSLWRGRGSDWINYHARAICKRLKLPHCSPHGLRGTHSSLAASAGATSHLVAATLGHGNTGVTERHYIDESAAAKSVQQRALTVLEGGRR